MLGTRSINNIFKSPGTDNKIAFATFLVTAIGLSIGLRSLSQAVGSLKASENANVQAAASLQETKRANQGNVILSLNRDFFFNDRLYKVRAAIENNKPILRENQGTLTDQDLDDYLGMFEMMDGLRARQILDEQLLNENFCTFIQEAYQNKEVMQYVARVQKDLKSSDIYSGFESLAQSVCN